MAFTEGKIPAGAAEFRAPRPAASLEAGKGNTVTSAEGKKATGGDRFTFKGVTAEAARGVFTDAERLQIQGDARKSTGLRGRSGRRG